MMAPFYFCFSIPLFIDFTSAGLPLGVTTLSIPSLIMLRKAIKLKLLGIFVVICTAGIIIVGCFFNAIQFLLV